MKDLTKMIKHNINNPVLANQCDEWAISTSKHDSNKLFSCNTALQTFTSSANNTTREKTL